MSRTLLRRLPAAITSLAIIAFTSVSVADYPTGVLGDNPIGYWRLGEAAGPTAQDETVPTNNLDYTLFPAGDFGQPGAIVGDTDTAVQFTPNEASPHPTIVSPNTTDFGFASGQSFSIEYWIKAAPGNTSANDAGVFSKGYDSTSQALPWYIMRYRPNAAGTVDLYLRDSSSANKQIGSYTGITNDQWHHVVGVYDSNDAAISIFVDGKLERSTGSVGADSYGTNSRPFTIGSHYSRALDVLLDDVAVYDSALDTVQVASHYLAGSGVSPDPALWIDFGSSANSGGGPGGGQTGFFRFEATEGDGLGDVMQAFPSSLGLSDSVDVTIGGFTHFRDYAGLTNTSGTSVYTDGASTLLSDMVLRNSDATMTLELENLEPGTYQMTTYHHSATFGGGTFDINLSDANGTSAIATDVVVSGGTETTAATSSTFTFVSDGSPVSVGFVGGANSEHLPLNGFRLVEAPTGPERLGVVLAVDFNDRGAPEATDPSVTQAGFSEFLIGGDENVDQTDPTTRTFGGIDVTLGHSNGLGVGDRRRGLPLLGALYSVSELQRDVLFARTTSGGATTDDGLDILIENLDSLAPYEIEIWSYDDGSGSDRVSDWSANGVLVMDDYTFNGSYTNPLGSLPFDDHAMFSFLTKADASGNILIEGRHAYANTEIGVFINGLRVTAVVPEPGTVALLVAGLLAMMPLWLRRRRT